jgi:hypothetical protein
MPSNLSPIHLIMLAPIFFFCPDWGYSCTNIRLITKIQQVGQCLWIPSHVSAMHLVSYHFNHGVNIHNQSKPLGNSCCGTCLFKMSCLAVMADIFARYAKPISIQCSNPSREMINTKHMCPNTCAFSTHRTARHNVVLDVGEPYLYSPIIIWYVKRKFELVANLFCIFDLNPIVVWFQITKKQPVCKAKYGFRMT